MMGKTRWDALRDWMLRNARPLDIARFRYHFEDASPAPVLEALAAYQNADGGFGHALEADSWNPHSTALTTWTATTILDEIGLEDREHPILQGIVRYLGSGDSFQDGLWLATAPSNNDHPHASWWQHDERTRETWGYNPTAALAGFAIRFAPEGSALLCRAEETARQAVEAYDARPTQDMHELFCYMQLADACEAAGRRDLFAVDALRQTLAAAAGQMVDRDRDKWEAGYVCRPSHFIHSRQSPYYAGFQAAAEDEAAFLLRTQRPDGTWPVSWAWQAYPEAWAISRLWWTGNLIIQNARYLKGFDAL